MTAQITKEGIDHYDKVRKGVPLTVAESVAHLVHGFKKFSERTNPHQLRGVSLVRIAGQAAALKNGSRDEVRGVIEKIKPGGVFLIFGHGGIIPCGAVNARITSDKLAKKGQELEEPEIIKQLVSNVCPNLTPEMSSKEASMINAKYQAKRILDDPEFGKMIKDMNITVVAAVCSDMVEYESINKTATTEQLFERHPKLLAIAKQVAKGLYKVTQDGINLKDQYAHAVIAYDPLRMRAVLDPYDPFLDVGGISCVDARLNPLVPDGPGGLIRSEPNSIFRLTIGMNETGVVLSPDDGGSLRYAFGHVGGVNILKPGSDGNGHLVILDTDITFKRVEMGVTAFLTIDRIAEATKEGTLITRMAFNGKELRVFNPRLDVDVVVPYEPKVRII